MTNPTDSGETVRIVSFKHAQKKDFVCADLDTAFELAQSHILEDKQDQMSVVVRKTVSGMYVVASKGDEGEDEDGDNGSRVTITKKTVFE